MHSCNLGGYDDDELDGVWEEVFSESTVEIVGPLRYWDIRDLAVGNRGGEEIIQNVALWGYKSGYKWIEGEKFRDSSMLNINVTKRLDELYLEFRFDFESLLPFPVVYDYNFGNDADADYLHVELVIRNNQNSRKIKLSDDVSLATKGYGSYNVELGLDEFKDLEVGNVTYTVELKTALTSFFDIRSKVKPVNAKFSFDFQVPQLYKTVLNFKSLRLNEEDTKKLLGDNDFSNSTPEAGISVLYNGNSVFFGFTKNNYNHTQSKKVDIYHLAPEISVDIRVLDVDYGFNSNDIIHDTTLNLGSLEGTDYFNLKMNCVDELLLFTQYKGKAN